MDRDGDLDLWIGNYVDADRTHSPFCGNARLGVRFYCNPLKYDPLPSTVYRNEGGVFTDVSAASSVAWASIPAITTATGDSIWCRLRADASQTLNRSGSIISESRFQRNAQVSSVQIMQGLEELSALIGDVYDASLDVTLWSRVLERIATWMGAPAAALMSHDVTSSTGGFHFSWGDDPRYTKLYFEKYVRLNPTVFPGTFAGTVTFVASKDGYQRDSRTVPLRPVPSEPGGLWDLAFYLEPLGPSANVVGAYTMTLTADSTCTKLPDEARRRTYTATIVSDFPGSRTSFLATLSDARFFSTHNRAWIATAGDFASFNISISDDQTDSFPGIAEQLRETTYVAFEG